MNMYIYIYKKLLTTLFFSIDMRLWFYPRNRGCYILSVLDFSFCWALFWALGLGFISCLLSLCKLFIYIKFKVAIMFWINLCFALCNIFLFVGTKNKFDLSRYNWLYGISNTPGSCFDINNKSKFNFQYLWFLDIGLSITNLIFGILGLSFISLWISEFLYL